MKAHIQPQELWPFYEVEKADTDLHLAVEMPSELFEDYVRIKADFIEVSDKIAVIDQQYRDVFNASMQPKIVSSESNN